MTPHITLRWLTTPLVLLGNPLVVVPAASNSAEATARVEGSSSGMVFPGETWAVATPAPQGVPETGLDEALAYLDVALEDYAGVGTVFIVRNGYVMIPDTIEGLPVTSIGSQEFMECTSLTRVTIPDRVTNIGEAAFYDCANLTSVSIGNGRWFQELVGKARHAHGSRVRPACPT